jgi:hypothetical protein
MFKGRSPPIHGYLLWGSEEFGAKRSEYRYLTIADVWPGLLPWARKVLWQRCPCYLFHPFMMMANYCYCWKRGCRRLSRSVPSCGAKIYIIFTTMFRPVRAVASLGTVTGVISVVDVTSCKSLPPDLAQKSICLTTPDVLMSSSNPAARYQKARTSPTSLYLNLCNAALVSSLVIVLHFLRRM